MAWVAQLHAVMKHHAWAAAVQTPGGVSGQFVAHQVLLVTLRAQQAGATGGGAAVASVPAAGSVAKEVSSFGPAVDQGHKSLAEMRERQVHPNMESVFRRTYSLPYAANSAVKHADMHEDEICVCADCACVECVCGVWSAGVEKTI